MSLSPTLPRFPRTGLAWIALLLGAARPGHATPPSPAAETPPPAPASATPAKAEWSAPVRALLALPWQEAWRPDPAAPWQDGWWLDGAQARVTPLPRGFELQAGAAEGGDAAHAVLWTRRSFAGDLRLDFRYTRLDADCPGRNRVNILYFHARGSGAGPYERDLARWRELRTVPAMKLYFEHTEAYHISFAAYAVGGPAEQDYVRMRRYLPERGQGLAGTEMLPTYHAPELFRVGVTYACTLLRRGPKIYFLVRPTAGALREFAWDAANFPLLTEGRVGLRHMAGRGARYEDFVVRTLAAPLAPGGSP